MSRSLTPNPLFTKKLKQGLASFALIAAVGVLATGCGLKAKKPMTNLDEPNGAKKMANADGDGFSSNSSAVTDVTGRKAPAVGNPWGPGNGVPDAQSSSSGINSEFAGGLSDSMIDESSNGIVQNANTDNVETAIEIADLDMVHFEYDSAEIKPSWQTVLDDHAQWLIQNDGVYVQVEGHCDERGTDEYNIALGQNRADKIREYLIGKGVSPMRISTISYGKMRPISFDTSNEAHSLNRRGMFLVYTPDFSTETAANY